MPISATICRQSGVVLSTKQCLYYVTMPLAIYQVMNVREETQIPRSFSSKEKYSPANHSQKKLYQPLLFLLIAWQVRSPQGWLLGVALFCSAGGVWVHSID